MKKYKYFKENQSVQKESEELLKQHINLTSCTRKEHGNSIMYIKNPTRFDADEAYFDIISYNDMVLLKFEIKIVISSSDPFYKQKIDSGVRELKTKKIKLDTSVDNIHEAKKEIIKFSQKVKNTKWEI